MSSSDIYTSSVLSSFNIVLNSLQEKLSADYISKEEHNKIIKNEYISKEEHDKIIEELNNKNQLETQEEIDKMRLYYLQQLINKDEFTYDILCKYKFLFDISFVKFDDIPELELHNKHNPYQFKLPNIMPCKLGTVYLFKYINSDNKICYYYCENYTVKIDCIFMEYKTKITDNILKMEKCQKYIYLIIGKDNISYFKLKE